MKKSFMEKEMYQVIGGKYIGRKGKVERFSDTTNVMFYPIEGKNPYCVCLKNEDVKEIAE